jgi:hypothetical protein
MKAKSLKVVTAAIFLSCVMVSSSFATSFVSAWVNRAKTTDGTVTVMLRYDSGSGCTWGTGGTNTNIWFDGTANMDDQALAVALTAISLGKTVRVGVEQCPTSTTQAGTFSSIGLDQ